MNQLVCLIIASNDLSQRERYQSAFLKEKNYEVLMAASSDDFFTLIEQCTHRNLVVIIIESAGASLAALLDGMKSRGYDTTITIIIADSTLHQDANPNHRYLLSNHITPQDIRYTVSQLVNLDT